MVHLELERVLRRKRATFSSVEEAVALLAWAVRACGVEPPAAVGIVRHAVEPMTGRLIEGLIARYPGASVISFEHLDCHAAIAGTTAAASAEVLAIDGGGDRRVGWGEPNAVLHRWPVEDGGAPRLLTAYDLPVDGRAWAVVSHALFGDVHAAGKTMGLAAYGRTSERAAAAVDALIHKSLHWRYDDTTLDALARELPVDTFEARANIAYALQEAFSAALLRLVDLVSATPGRQLVLTGGCALNVTANSVISRLITSRSGSVWVPPCPGDEGISMGAALLAAASVGEPVNTVDLPFLGAGSAPLSAEAEFRQAAELLARGAVVVTAVGRAEIGPRALGNRSFLALPSTANKRRVSEQMKGREAFRPVAPAVRAADASRWLADPIESPFMSFASPVTEALAEAGPGVVHVDGTARHQSVHPSMHPVLHTLLDHLADLGVPPVLINTSLNRRGHPICLDASDALATAIATGADGILTADGLTRLR